MFHIFDQPKNARLTVFLDVCCLSSCFPRCKTAPRMTNGYPGKRWHSRWGPQNPRQLHEVKSWTFQPSCWSFWKSRNGFWSLHFLGWDFEFWNESFRWKAFNPQLSGGGSWDTTSVEAKTIQMFWLNCSKFQLAPHPFSWPQMATECMADFWLGPTRWADDEA